jgi:hypothetical protein
MILQRSVATFLLGALGCALFSPVGLLGGQTAADSVAFHAALERWHAALDPTHNRSLTLLSFTPYFGHSSKSELDDSVKALSEIGANMIPFMVEQIRIDTRTLKDAMADYPAVLDATTVTFESAARRENEPGRAVDRLDKDVALLFMLGGIQITTGLTDRSLAHWLERIDGFLEEWDAGSYSKLEARLRGIRDEGNEEPDSQTVDYRKTFPYRRYGVYALPFLLNEIRDHNSAECFNAFLIITFHRDLYVTHHENPRQVYPTIADKMNFIRAWWRENQQKFSQLGELTAKIQAVAGSDR